MLLETDFSDPFSAVGTESRVTIVAFESFVLLQHTHCQTIGTKFVNNNNNQSCTVIDGYVENAAIKYKCYTVVTITIMS